MDKQNYTLTVNESQAIRKNISAIKRKVISLFKKHRLIKRQRELKSYSVLFRAIFVYLTEALSFQKLSDYMAVKTSVCMSDIAWRKWFLLAAPVFFEVANEFLASYLSALEDKTPVYLLDATNFSMEGGSQTEIRVHTQLALKTGTPVAGNITDLHTGESITNFSIEKDAVYLADRAYGKASQLSYLYDHESEFIIRISPQMIRLYKDPDCTQRLEHSELLKETRFVKTCYFSYHKKVYPLCIIGEQIPEDKREKAQKRVQYESNRKKRNTHPETITFATWVIVAVPAKYAQQGEKAFAFLEFYRNRWQIELFFKRSKGKLNLHRIRKGSQRYAKAVVMIWFAIAIIIGQCQSIFSSLRNISLDNSFSLFSSLFFNS